jgi:ketosteroid isomerase-like protein
MTRRFVCGLALASLLGTPAFSSAQTATAALEALELKRFKAMQDNDLQTLAPLLADDLVYTHSSGVADTKAAYLEALRSGKTRYHSAASQTMSVRVYGETALINGRVKVTVESNGQKNDLHLSYLDVWVRRGGNWQMVAWQSARLAAPQ